MPLNHPVYTKTVLSLYVLFTGWPGYRITSFCDPNILQHSQLPHGCLGLTCSAYHPFSPCWLRCQVQILFCQKCVCAFLTHEKINSPPNLKWFSLHPTQIRFNSHPYLQFHALAQGEFFCCFPFFILIVQASHCMTLESGLLVPPQFRYREGLVTESCNLKLGWYRYSGLTMQTHLWLCRVSVWHWSRKGRPR